MDIIITIPKSIKWVDYLKEIKTVEDGSYVMNFKVSNFPKGIVVNESKCYLVHDGKLKGYMYIVGTEEKEFTCTTTGKKWKGKFIQRSGKFYQLENEISMKGFQGFRYYK